MRTAAIFGLVFLATAQTACRPGPAPLEDAERGAIIHEVEETMARLTEAMNSHDPDRVLAFYENSEDFVYLGCTEFLFGFEALSGRLRTYYQANPKVEFEQEVVRTQVLGPDVAIVALQGRSTKADGLFRTEVLHRKMGGEWLVTYEHESWPGCPPPPVPHPFTTEGEMEGMDLLSDTLGSNGG